MTIKTTVKTCLTATVFLASSTFADTLSWQYLDLRYQQPSDSNTRGLAGEVSGHISKNWILQGRASRIRLKESDLDLEMTQMRYDLAVGRVFSFNDRFATLVSAGYTHLDYSAEIGSFEDDAKDHAANIQADLLARITDKLEIEAGLGILVDDKDTSDLLWNAGLRYWASKSVSILIGAKGINNDSFDGDDVLYEIGFRFNLK